MERMEFIHVLQEYLAKHDESQHEGIRIIDIARWLSDSQK
jgi:hypothetical protein